MLGLTLLCWSALVASAAASSVTRLSARFVLGGDSRTVAADRARNAAQLTLGAPPETTLVVPELALSGHAALGGAVSTAGTGSVFVVNCTIGAGSAVLLVDTGSFSSNTWIGARQTYATSASTSSTGQSLAVQYGSGAISGKQLVDNFSIGPLSITNQEIGSTTPNVFSKFGVDGILGLGPTGLTVGKMSPNTTRSSPTVLDTMLAQGVIAAPILSIYLTPSGASSGQLIWGGIDPTLSTSAFVAVSKSSESPASRYWSVNLAAGQSLIATAAPAITDTGTTLIVIASDFFDTYLAEVQAAVPSARLDSTNGFIAVPTASVASAPGLNIGIDGRPYNLIPDATFLPESQSEQFGGWTGFRYSVVASSGRASGAGFDVTLGMHWLTRYATAYDASTGLFSIASTKYTTMLYSQLASTLQVGSAPVAAPPPAQTNAVSLSPAAVAAGFSTAVPAQPSSLSVSPAAPARGRASTSSQLFLAPALFALTTVTTWLLYIS